MLVQSMHYSCERKKVVKCYMDFRALRNSNEWTGYLWHFPLLGKRVDFRARTRFGFRVPITLLQFEVKRQDSVLQLSGRFTIGVGSLLLLN